MTRIAMSFSYASPLEIGFSVGVLCACQLGNLVKTDLTYFGESD